jgi:copper chaperone
MAEIVTINVPDMTCAHCEETIRSALTSLNPNANIEVDLPAQVVRVDLPAGDALAAIVEAGYSPQVSAG